MEDNATSLSSEEGGSVPESPKPMAFTIDFGGGKSVDSSRHKTLVEKYQKRHRRGQSLSTLDDSPTAITTPPPAALKKHPLSANLPRKAASVQSEGYSSCDEKVERFKNNVRLRDGLSLPLKNVNSDKMTQSCTLPCIESPDVELTNAITPESPTITSPPIENEQFIDGTEFDFDKSDTASDTGTYTLDADNYTEEQKARMSIDRDFKIEKVTVYRKTQEYVQSLSAQNNVPRRLSPIVSPTQNLSIIQDAPKVNNDDPNRTMTKIMFPSPKAKTGINPERPLDQGSIISVTSSGAFRSKSENERRHMRQLSLSKSEVHVEAYTYNSCCTTELARPNLSANLVLVSENLPKPPIEKLVNLPPPVGGVCGKISPTKIPSPIHTSRPRSRNSSLNVDLSDSSLETESYLKPTQNLLNSLQQRLSLDHDHDSEYLNNDARNLLKKPTHLRHNSLDDRNLKISNKLEHFQTKNFIDQTYTNVLNQYSHNKVHKIQNSPNNSPIRRSSSFSTKNQINTKCSNIPQQKESNIRNSPSFARNGSIQRSSSTASMRPGAMLLRRSSVNQFGDTESSSEEDLKEIIKKQDITNTRYNRAFSLRRARLDEAPPPPPKCPNTPEMRRKFQPDARAERAISVDRKPMRTNDVQSRYMQNVTRGKTAPPQVPVSKVVEVKGSPKIGSVKAAAAVKPQAFSRTDTGRFSMRTAKPPPVTNSQKTIRKEFMGKKPSGPRSNSSLTSKEVDFQNWKRRKSYDPMKAAAEGKRKAEMAKKQTSTNPMTQSYHEGNQDYDDSSPSHSSSVHRSQSFHGTAALEQYISSEEEEDLTLSPDEGFSPPTPSPCELSPNRMHLRYAWKDQLLH